MSPVTATEAPTIGHPAPYTVHVPVIWPRQISPVTLRVYRHESKVTFAWPLVYPPFDHFTRYVTGTPATIEKQHPPEASVVQLAIVVVSVWSRTRTSTPATPEYWYHGTPYRQRIDTHSVCGHAQHPHGGANFIGPAIG
jgi:hypothetical protein